MGQAKHAPTTPPNRLHSRACAAECKPSRRAALASVLALSTAAGVGAIAAGAELLPKAAAAEPESPDAAILAFVALLLPDIERLEAMSEQMKREGRMTMTEEHRTLAVDTTAEAFILADMRPVTLPGFIAKARIARYHLFLGLAIARDLDALGSVRPEHG